MILRRIGISLAGTSDPGVDRGGRRAEGGATTHRHDSVGKDDCKRAISERDSVFSRENWERNELAIRRQDLFLLLRDFHPLPPPHPTSTPTIPSIRSRRMSFFSRKKNVSLSMFSRYHFGFLIILFLSLFSSFHTGEAPDPGGATSHTGHSRQRNVCPFLSLQSLRPP